MVKWIYVQRLWSGVIATIFMFFALCGVAYAQSSDLIRGDDAFAEGYYSDALEYYKKVLRKNKSNVELLYKVAESARYCNDYKQAASYYKQLRECTGGVSAYPNAVYYLATMYRYDDKPDSAIVFYLEYLQQKKYKKLDFEIKAEQELKSCQWVIEQRKNVDSVAMRYKINHLGKQINTKMNEAAAVMVETAILFARTMHISKSESKNAMFSEYILTQVYQASYMKNGKLGKSVLNEWGFNKSDMHSGNIAYDPSTNTIYLTFCTDGSEGGESICNIYKSKYNKKTKKWETPVKMLSDINIEGYTSTQPTIGHTDGKTILYYVSNRPGGNGGMDIWYVAMDSSHIGKSVNLGSPINTPGNEITPFYSESSRVLYFASDWHYGYGGYDVFMSKGGRDQWSAPRNMGEPINTSANDLYFSVNYTDTTRGFVTSNREGSFFTPGNTCCNDIYEWYIEQDTACPCLKMKKDTIIPVYINLSLQQKARMLIPISLYFHNDEPNPRSLAQTTTLTYSDTYKSYIDKQEQYIDMHNMVGDTAEAERVGNFFADSVVGNYNKLENFISLLTKDLHEGNRVKLLIKGFASPLHTNDYNYNLSQRRISSFVNQLLQIDTTLFAINENFAIEQMPFGSSKAAEGVSSSRSDVRHSVYSADAALERKIEILDYYYYDIKEEQPQEFFIGNIEKDTVAKIILGFVVTGYENASVDYVLGDMSDVQVEVYPADIPNCNLPISFVIDTHKKKVSENNSIDIELRVGENKMPIKCRLLYNVVK